MEILRQLFRFIIRNMRKYVDRMRSRTNRYLCLVALVSILVFVDASGVMAAQTSPTLNNGKKWRIGYYEGGPFSDYTDTMGTFIEGVMALGWIKGETPPEPVDELPKPYWNWLTQCNSPFLSFNAQDSYSAGWDHQNRLEIRKALLEKLKTGALDLVIAMGTWAGLDLANNEHARPGTGDVHI